MKAKNACNLPESADITNGDGILIIQNKSIVRMTMDKLRKYIGYATGADVLGVPVPTSADAGKVAMVNETGDGYNLFVLPERVTVESADYPGCYYHVVDGEKEWVNPPLILDEEYRTLERYNGKVVYAMRVQREYENSAFINPMQTGTITAPSKHAIVDLVGCKGRVKLSSGWHFLPYHDGTTTIEIGHREADPKGSFSTYLKGDIAAGIRIDCVLYYTKE